MQPPTPAHSPRAFAGWLALLLILAAGGGLWWIAYSSGASQDHSSVSSRSKSAGPPWLYGRADARFTVVLYADLECPYCRDYLPALTRWIDANPDVNGQWHHLPLPMHNLAAQREARLAECAGEVGGHDAFWSAAAWIYRHTRSSGQGLPADTAYPDLTPALQACLDSDRPDAIIRTQTEAAARDGIVGTPTLRLHDRNSGKTILLHGPVDGDALLSALDLLASPADASEEIDDSRTQADSVSKPK
ncbi:disulfide bond formation protein DsbA [Pseudomonas sp. PIC25]|nr:disulfide bond formation protein DsbA [Pseudomonas sp. PIC25]